MQQELQARLDESDRLRRQQVQRARYRSRILRSAGTCASIRKTDWLPIHLEADWNQKLRALTETQQDYEQHLASRTAGSSMTTRRNERRSSPWRRISPRLRRDPATEDRDRKRMIRLLVEDVHQMLRGGEDYSSSAIPWWRLQDPLTLPNPLRSHGESWTTRYL